MSENKELRIFLDAGGKIQMSRPQQHWRGDEIMQTAIFAGHEIMLITDDAGAFDLYYLGFMVRGFASMDDAKANAKAFVKNVLTHMAELV